MALRLIKKRTPLPDDPFDEAQPQAGLSKEQLLLRALLFAACFLSFALRSILSISVSSVSAELDLSNPQQGQLLSAFFVGYGILRADVYY